MRQWLLENAGLSFGLQGRLLRTLMIVGGLWLAHRLALALMYRRVQDPWVRYKWRKTISYVALLLGLLLVGVTWIQRAGSLATYLGLFSAGLAIALKDIVANLAGWAFISWSRPFEVGDRVQIGSHAGDVIDLHPLQFTLNEIGNWVAADQSTGRIIHVPNGRVLSEPIANYDKGFRYIWNEIPVTVTFASNWKKAKEILAAVAVRHAEHLTEQLERDLLEASRQYLIAYTKLTPIVYTRATSDGVCLTLRYLIRSRFRRGSENAIWQDVLEEFAAAPDIDFAHSTAKEVRLSIEGNPATPPTI
ncbi:MAG: mechanosensitive ion channel family protein [Gemmatimonadales bacterium]